jgi:DNA polymerase III delta subunit
MPRGSGRGIAVHAMTGSYVAQIAEVTVANDTIRVNKVICGVDCGVVINPDTLAAQIEGGIIYGLTCALKNEITVKDVEAVSGHTRLSNLNHLAEGIEGKRIEASVRIMENLIAEGEVPLRVLATISRIIRRLLIAKSLLEEKKSSHQEIRQELNLNPYFDKNFFNNLSLFTLSGLEEGMGRILAADAELKQSARPETMILEELILALCRK